MNNMPGDCLLVLNYKRGLNQLKNYSLHLQVIRAVNEQAAS